MKKYIITVNKKDYKFHINSEELEPAKATFLLKKELSKDEYGSVAVNIISDVAFTFLLNMETERCKITFNFGNCRTTVSKY